MRIHRTHISPVALLLVLLVATITSQSASAHELLKRGGVDVVDHDESRFWLDVGLGAVSHGEIGFDFDEPTLTVAPRWKLRSRAKHRLYFSAPVVWMEDAGSTPGADFGSSTLLLPSLEWLQCTDGCVRPSFFVGAGVRLDRVRATPAVLLGPGGSVVGSAPSEELVHPAVTFGGSIQRPLRPKLGLRFEARLVTTWYDDEDVTTAAGATTTLNLGTEVELFVSVGLQFGF